MQIMGEAASLVTKTWFPFLLLGGVCLLYVLAPWHFAYRRQAKGFVYFSHRIVVIFAALLTFGGFAALIAGQPHFVWKNYSSAGILGSALFWGSGRALNRIYSDKEQKQLSRN